MDLAVKIKGLCINYSLYNTPPQEHRKQDPIKYCEIYELDILSTRL